MIFCAAIALTVPAVSPAQEFEPDVGSDKDLADEIEQASPSPTEVPKEAEEINEHIKKEKPEVKAEVPRTGAEKSYAPANGGVMFDWSKYQNATEVPHPFAEKGLLRITRDKTYIYRVDESEQTTATAVRFGQFYPEDLEAPGKNGTTNTFADNYDQTDNPTILVDWEWQLWRSPIGKLGATVGAGAYVAQGNGHFDGDKNVGQTPREVFTLAVIPVSAGAVYHAQFWHKQMFIPYAVGGGVGFGFGEFRDDNKAPKWGGAYGLYAGAGVAFNLTYFDAVSRIQLDREYGINGVFLTGEYRRIIGMGTFDFSSDLANAGFLMEY